MNKAFKQKMEITRTINMLKRQIDRLDRQKKEFLDRAKNARLKGDNQLYRLARTMLKSIMNASHRLEVMLMNIEFAVMQRDFVEHNRAFVSGMKQLGKGLIKTAAAAIMLTALILPIEDLKNENLFSQSETFSENRGEKCRFLKFLAPC